MALVTDGRFPEACLQLTFARRTFAKVDFQTALILRESPSSTLVIFNIRILGNNLTLNDFPTSSEIIGESSTSNLRL